MEQKMPNQVLKEIGHPRENGKGCFIIIGVLLSNFPMIENTTKKSAVVEDGQRMRFKQGSLPNPLKSHSKACWCFAFKEVKDH